MYSKIMCDMKNLYEAYRLAHRSKTDSMDVIEFDKHKFYYLNVLKKKLENKEWDKIFVYYRFMIREPKERVVDALTFEGRIVQHVLCDKILKPYFEQRLIKENCACRCNKGTDYALNLLKSDMVKFLKHNSDGYVLKMDVKKYFPSIDRSVLKDKIKNFPDKEIKELLFYIINNSPDFNGLPIGNQTSQWFALYYLDEIDRIIKEKYKIKYYTRYMDDLIIIHTSKNYLNMLLAELKIIAKSNLKLEFNNKTQIFPLHKGISFLGWKFLYTNTKKIIQKIDGSKIELRKKKIREIKKQFEENKTTKQKFDDRILAVRVNLNHGNTYNFQTKYLKTSQLKLS